MVQCINLNSKQKDVLDLIIRDIVARARFFDRVSEGIWFYHLKEAGFFNPRNNLCPKENESGKYCYPSWDILPYLEKLTTNIVKGCEHDVEYEDILEIMENTATFINNGNPELSNNFFIGISFAKILSIMPTDKYKIEHLQILNIWITAKDDNTMIASEIYANLIPKLLRENLDSNFQKIKYLLDSLFNKYTKIKYDNNSDLFWVKEFFNNNLKLILNSSHCFDIVEIILKKMEKLLKHTSSEISVIDSKGEQITAKLVITDSNSELSLNSKEHINISDDDLQCFPKFYAKAKEPFSKILKNENENSKNIWNIYYKLFDEYCYESIYAFKDKFLMDIIVVLVCAVKNLFEIKGNTQSISQKDKIIKRCLNSKYLLLTKIGMFGLAKNISFSNSDQIFVNVLNDENISDKVFDSFYTEDELAKILNVLKENSSCDILLKKITLGPRVYWEKEEAHDLEKKLWQQERCYELKNYHEFRTLYAKLRKETHRDRILHPILSFSGSELKIMSEKSKFNAQKILAMTPNDIENMLNSFNPKNRNMDETIHELGAVLQKAAGGLPELFLLHQEHFVSIGYIYTYNILHAFYNLIKEEKFTLWNDLLDYMYKLISNPSFWENKFIIDDREGWKADCEWVVSEICEIFFLMIEKKVEIVIEKIVYIVKIMEIITNRIDKNGGQMNDSVLKDLPTYLLNNTWGKVISVWLNIGLELKKQPNMDVDGNDYMKNVIKKLSALINSHDETTIAYAGLHLPWLYYINPEFAKNIVLDVNKMECRYKKLFVVGYLYNNQLNNIIAEDLVELYSFGLTKILEGPNRKRLVMHIALEYLTDTKGKFDQMYKTICDQNQVDDFVSIFNLFTYILKDENKKKIYSFWHYVMSNEMFKNKEDMNKIYAATAPFAEKVDKFDGEEAELLLQAAPAIVEAHDLFYILDMVDRVKEKGDDKKTLSNIIKLFTFCFSHGYPIYDEKKRNSITSFINKKLDDGVISDDLLTAKNKMDYIFFSFFPTQNLYLKK